MIRVPKNKIAVDPIPDPNKIGHIWIPDVAMQREDQGIVKYIGEDVREIMVGDYVLFSGYTGTLVLIEGEGPLIIMPEEFVVARLEPPDTEIPGLYFQGSDGLFFTATYEMAITIISKAFQEAGMSERMKIRDLWGTRPKVEDYDKLKGGA